MGCNRIAVLFSTLLVAFASSKEYVPVLLLGSIESASNGAGVSALSKLAGDEFREYLLKLVDNNGETARPPVLLVFAEESLSVEDFSWANVGDDGVYPRLMNITRPGNSVFLPAVHHPLKALEGLTESGFKWVKYTPTQLLMAITAGKDKIIPKVTQDTKGVVVYIDLEDATPSEDRPDMLRRHDTFIVDAFEKLKGDRELIVMYAANHSSWYDTEGEEIIMNMLESEDEDYVREIRSSARHLLADPTAKPDDTYVFYKANTSIYLYSDAHPILYKSLDPDSGTPLNGKYSVSLDNRNQQSQSLRVTYKVDSYYVIFNIFFEKSKRRYWSLTHIKLETNSSGNNSGVILKPNKQVEAPVGFSYHCGQTMAFTNASEGVKLVFDGFQVQSFIRSDKVTFGDAYDCVYFFTAAIWSGLFVTLLLGLILTWGLSMIMSIRTMDRFDDPKGKTITIGGAE